jgi:hypothetical protein
MSDIVGRLRNWRTVHLTQLRYVMESAADEIERLRLSGNGSCPEPENAASEDKVFLRQNMTTLTDEIARLREEKASDWKAACESTRLASTEIARLRLTAAERDVMREVCRVYADEDDAGCNEIAFAIDRILARLDGAANSLPDHRTGCGECRTGSNDATAGEDAAKCTVKSKKCPERDRLTDEEREAVEVAAEAYADDHGERFAATLRALLERLG